MSRPYGFYSLPYQTQMSIRRNESDVRRAQGRAAANAREAEAAAEELNALRSRPTATELVERWEQEWLASGSSANWGDDVAWGVAKKIAARIDAEQGAGS